jgi:sortase A
MELSAWTLGLGLMLAYGTARVVFERARTEGIDAFRSARPIQRAGVAAAASVSGDPAHIDQTLWSEQRKLAFAASPSSHSPPEGLLRIPSVDLEVPIYDGTSEINLNRGAGHIEGTTPLAQTGNIGIAAHRDGFFRKLKDVEVESMVDLEVGGRLSHYRVTEIRIVAPTNVDVLAPTRIPSITLVTCYPFYFVGTAPLRYIVRAELVDTKLASSEVIDRADSRERRSTP